MTPRPQPARTPRLQLAVVAVAAAAVAAAVFSAGTTFGAAAPSEWLWYSGEPHAFVAESRDIHNLELRAENSLVFDGGHVRLGTADGSFEFEHGRGVPTSRLVAYAGKGFKRTTIRIGTEHDDQDVTPLRVTGNRGQKHDLQQWVAGSRVVAAIDGRGRLRLGEVTLAAVVRKGRVVLLATLPDGRRAELAVAPAR